MREGSRQRVHAPTQAGPAQTHDRGRSSSESKCITPTCALLRSLHSGQVGRGRSRRCSGALAPHRMGVAPQCQAWRCAVTQSHGAARCAHSSRRRCRQCRHKRSPLQPGAGRMRQVAPRHYPHCVVVFVHHYDVPAKRRRGWGWGWGGRRCAASWAGGRRRLEASRQQQACRSRPPAGASRGHGLPPSYTMQRPHLSDRLSSMECTRVAGVSGRTAMGARFRKGRRFRCGSTSWGGGGGGGGGRGGGGGHQ